MEAAFFALSESGNVRTFWADGGQHAKVCRICPRASVGIPTELEKMGSMYFQVQGSDEKKALYKRCLEKHAECYSVGAEFLESMVGVMQDATPKDGKFQYAVVYLLARHMVEALDAMAVLILQGCNDPCRHQIRTMLEAYWGLRYLLEADTEQRALAYQVAAIHKRIAFLKKLVQPSGKYSAEEHGFLDINEPALVNAHIAAFEADLQLPVYVPIEKEWQVRKAKRQKGRKENYDTQYYPYWYELFGGPKSVHALAEHLQGTFLWDFFYSPLSEFTHVGAVMDNIAQDKDGPMKSSVRPLRHPEGLQQLGNAGPVLAMMAADHIKNKYFDDAKSKTRFEEELMAKVKPAMDEMRRHGMDAPWR